MGVFTFWTMCFIVMISCLKKIDVAAGFCSGRANGNYANPENCHKYYNCWGGYTWDMQCQATLMFNDAQGYCDYPSNVYCATTTTDAQTTQETSTSLHTTVDGTETFSPSTEATTATTEVTTTATTVSTTTAVGSTTDAAITTSTITATNVSPTVTSTTTEGTPTTSTTSATTATTTSAAATTTTTTTGAQTTTDPTRFCEGRSNGYYADPGNCRKFYICINDFAWSMQCPDSLVYNGATGACDYLQNVNCNPAMAPTSTEPTPTSQHSTGVSTTANTTATTTTTGPTGPCNPALCNSQNCRCPGLTIPGGLNSSQTPMMIMLTFDDGVASWQMNYYRTLLSDNYRNPNNCSAKFTFFVSGDNYNPASVEELFTRGHEVASHSKTHRFPPSWWANCGYYNYVDEIVGMRNKLRDQSNIPENKIKGMRVPFLQIGGNDQYRMLRDYGFTYDSSMASSQLSWPFTLDYAVNYTYSFIGPNPDMAFPGLWEVPLNRFFGGRNGYCSMPDTCDIEGVAANVTQYLMDNFLRHYNHNKTPFGIFIHSTWFDNKAHSFQGLRDFLNGVGEMADVWTVSVSQMLDWVKNPIPINSDGLVEKNSWQC